MKRFILIALMLVAMAGYALAADSVSQQILRTSDFDEYRIIVNDSDSNGTFSAISITGGLHGYLVDMITIPSGSPTDNYDITITDEFGHDVLDGYGANRDTATIESVHEDGYSWAAVNGAANINISGNSQADVEITIRLFVTRSL